VPQCALFFLRRAVVETEKIEEDAVLSFMKALFCYPCAMMQLNNHFVLGNKRFNVENPGEFSFSHLMGSVSGDEKKLVPVDSTTSVLPVVNNMDMPMTLTRGRSAKQVLQPPSPSALPQGPNATALIVRTSGPFRRASVKTPANASLAPIVTTIPTDTLRPTMSPYDAAVGRERMISPHIPSPPARNA
jgi:hypothetical protein